MKQHNPTELINNTAQVGEYQTLRILGLQGFLENLHSEYPFFSIIFHKQIEGTRNFFPPKKPATNIAIC